MKNKPLLISTVLCLLPIVLSVALYSKLPDQIAVHFNSAGEPDNYLPKAVASFGMPIILAAINLYSHFRVNKDPKVENAAASLKVLAKWLVPLLSVILMPVTLFIAMGVSIPFVLIIKALSGVIVAVCGNYLPKCKRNYTVGFKLPWTLDSEENWNKTHRFAGFIWVAGGVIMTLCAFLSVPWVVTLAVFVLLVVLPFLYSYLYYQKCAKDVK